MDVSTFEFLCFNLVPSLQRQDTNMRSAIPVQVKVTVSISRLATSNSMQSIADLFRIGQQAVNQFTHAVKLLLLKRFIRWPSTTTMDKFAREFEDIHGIPYVVDAVDDSHIPNVALSLHAADYYNRKGFHSILLQGVVSSKYLFWDFDIGWARSMHDANLWGRTAISQFCKAGKLAPYALVGDASYPCRPWMLAPFRGDNLWKTKWLQDASDEVHNGLSLMTPSGPARQEKLAINNELSSELGGYEDIVVSRPIASVSKELAQAVDQFSKDYGLDSEKVGSGYIGIYQIYLRADGESPVKEPEEGIRSKKVELLRNQMQMNNIILDAVVICLKEEDGALESKTSQENKLLLRSLAYDTLGDLVLVESYTTLL
ncbi:hypothetical protein AXG93_1089s1000 [Marchantia polymorpha subsp. ruderalis]|uniref:DDE Tnp4 domain-containing protein n=1 Tax=Marchantia polymorpha subsp. ruderalis TaxID=1480154 RepID=A0A176WIS8_MARPO|nr:hypothetical protein AXG93_1089s1000 [Marchantia polymorpha subsp. ruderalis]